MLQGVEQVRLLDRLRNLIFEQASRLAHLRLAGGGEKDERDMAPAEDFPRERDPVHLGHLQIEQHDIVGLRLQFVQGLPARGNGDRHHSPGLELGLENVPVGGVVIDDQDGTGFEQRRFGLHLDGPDNRSGLQDRGEGKGRAGARLAFHPHGAAHQFGQPFADDQAEAGAAVAPRGRAVHLLERLEKFFRGFLGDADAGVGDGEKKVMALVIPGLDLNVDNDFAPLGKFDRVSDQVDEDLPQAGGVADQIGGNFLRDEVGRFQMLAPDLDHEKIDRFLDALPQIEGTLLEVHLARFDLGKIQDVVDDGQERLAAGMDCVHAVALGLGQRRVGKDAGHADDPVHRGADFMAHHGEKFALGPLRRLGLARQFLLMGQRLEQAQLAFAQFPRGLPPPLDARDNEPHHRAQDDRHARASQQRPRGCF